MSNPLALFMQPIRVSKYRRKGDDSAGFEAGKKYLSRKRLHRGGGPSNLKKLQRTMNIVAGLRPARFDNRSAYMRSTD